MKSSPSTRRDETCGKMEIRAVDEHTKESFGNFLQETRQQQPFTCLIVKALFGYKIPFSTTCCSCCFNTLYYIILEVLLGNGSSVNCK